MCQLEKAKKIIEELRKYGYKAYFCGGCVRDFLLNRKPKDYDIVTDAHTQEIQKIFKHTLPLGAKFGIIKVLYGKDNFEVATFRKDGDYEDGRRPASVIFCDEKEDALRRDFTINGLFLDPVSNTIIDYVNGQEDIKEKIIRTIGIPSERFSEDHLRLMRAIRFSAQLSFEIADDTWKALTSMASLIQTVSWERIRDELSNMLLCKYPERAIALLQKSGLLSYIMPEWEEYEEKFSDVLEMLKLAAPISKMEMALGILLWPFLNSGVQSDREEVSLKNIAKRLCLSRKSTEYLTGLKNNYHSFENIVGMSLANFKRFLGLSDFFDLLEIYRLEKSVAQGNLDLYWYCQNKFKEFGIDKIKPIPLLDGNDLMHIGFKPGPIFKDMLYFIEEQQLEGNISTREQAIQLIKSHFGEGKNIET